MKRRTRPPLAAVARDLQLRARACAQTSPMKAASYAHAANEAWARIRREGETA